MTGVELKPPPDQQHLTDLLRSHAAFIGNRPGGIRGALKFHDLSGINLRGYALAGIDLTGTRLCDADLSGADLSDAAGRQAPAHLAARQALGKPGQFAHGRGVTPGKEKAGDGGEHHRQQRHADERPFVLLCGFDNCGAARLPRRFDRAIASG